MPRNLQVNYAGKHAAVMEKIARLQSIVEDLPSPEHPQLAWSDHGELCRLERDLEAILEYLES